jgi:ABC-2 type transport system permease protein
MIESDSLTQGYGMGGAVAKHSSAVLPGGARPGPGPGAVPLTESGRPARLSLSHLTKSEWTKAWTIRSTWWLLGLIVVIAALMTAVVAVNVSTPTEAAAAKTGMPSWALNGVIPVSQGMVYLGLVWGALMATSEYSSGAMSATMIAVPKRLPVLWSKAIVVAGTAFALGTVLTAATAGTTAFAVSAKGWDIGFGVTELRILVGCVLFSVLTCLLGLGIGMLAKRSVGGVTGSLGLMLVVPLIVEFLPEAIQHPIAQFLPNNLGNALLMGTESGTPGGWWGAMGLYLAWVLLFGALAALRVTKQDV